MVMMFISKRLVSLIGILLLCTSSFSQGLKVKEFTQNLNDGSAFHAPMDADGHPCGLIKVRSNNPDLHFRGDVISDVENKMNEYWVYVSQNSQFLKINHPNFMPIVISFSDYGIDVSPKATYILTLEETKYNKEKTGVTIIVKPEDSGLYIDDLFVDNLSGNGYYQLFLPKGEHVCKLMKTGYRPNVQVVQTGKTSQNINVELESIMAELDVKCKTTTAEIYIDNELKGNGTWKGEILAGEHKIEARQQNFNSHIQTITLAEKENMSFIIPELKRAMGKVHIETEPSNFPVIIDGKLVGTSPCTLDIESGNHYVSCKSYGIIQNRSDFEINGDEMNTVSLRLQFTDDDYQKAYNGDLGMILWMAIDKNWRGEYEESVFWMEKYPQKETLLRNYQSYWNSKNEIYGWWRCEWIKAYCEVGMPEKAIELFPYFRKEAERNGGGFDESRNMSYIGDGLYKKKEIDKAIQYYEKASNDGLEGLGDCYASKGDKQRAASYYREWLNLGYSDGRKRVEKKLNELGKWGSLDVTSTPHGAENAKKDAIPITTQENKAWFMFGTKSELKRQQVLDENDMLRSDFRKEYFTKIDIRIDKEIKLFCRQSAEILTSHPINSYTLQLDDRNEYVLRISDPQAFWSTSKYLVVMVK